MGWGGGWALAAGPIGPTVAGRHTHGLVASTPGLHPPLAFSAALQPYVVLCHGDRADLPSTLLHHAPGPTTPFPLACPPACPPAGPVSSVAVAGPGVSSTSTSQVREQAARLVWLEGAARLAWLGTCAQPGRLAPPARAPGAVVCCRPAADLGTPPPPRTT